MIGRHKKCAFDDFWLVQYVHTAVQQASPDAAVAAARYSIPIALAKRIVRLIMDQTTNNKQHTETMIILSKRLLRLKRHRGPVVTSFTRESKSPNIRPYTVSSLNEVVGRGIFPSRIPYKSGIIIHRSRGLLSTAANAASDTIHSSKKKKDSSQPHLVSILDRLEELHLIPLCDVRNFCFIAHGKYICLFF